MESNITATTTPLLALTRYFLTLLVPRTRPAALRVASNTTGNSNTANGFDALYDNHGIGNNNTANGVSALFSNTTGSNNTANGYLRLEATPPAVTTRP